jgi:hypothetical protein
MRKRRLGREAKEKSLRAAAVRLRPLIDFS